METKGGGSVNDPLELAKEQIMMLQLSDRDIAAGKLISQEDLDKNDMEWLQRTMTS